MQPWPWLACLPGSARHGQTSHIDPTRADHVDLVLTVATILLAAVGLVVTVGAVVIGIVAWRTTREIKEDATNKAKAAAAIRINETIEENLEPEVATKLRDALPNALEYALITDELGYRILRSMAERGELDEVLERVVVRLQSAGPEQDRFREVDENRDVL